MPTKIQSEFLFIGRGDEGFLENYSYELEDDPDRKGGTLFMSLEILNNDAEAEDIGEAVFANLKQKFYEDLDRPPYDRFEDAIKAANATLSDFRAGKVTRFIGNLNILMGAFVGDELFITAAGDAEAYLIRKRFVSVISEGLSENKGGEEGDFFSNIGSGVLEDSDTVLLSSSRLLRYITKNDLAKLFTGALSSDLSSLQETLMTEILGRAAVIGLSIEKEKELGEGVFEEEVAGEKKAVSLPGPFGGFLQKFYVHKHIRRIFQWGASKTGGFASISGRFKTRDFSRDRVLIALAVVIILLLGGIIWLRQKGATNKQISEQDAVLTQAQELINDAATKGQFDRGAGAALLKQSEDLVLKVLGTRFLRSKASHLMDEIQKQRSLLDNVKIVENPKVLVNLADKKRDVSALGLVFLKDRLYAFTHNSLFEIILDRLQDPLTINDTESVILGAAFPDSEALAFLTRAGKMIEFREGRFQFMDTADKIWKKGTDLKTYNDRLYILDSERNQIWRYRRKRDAYDAGEGINIDGDLRNAVAIAIDASVYAVNKDGSLVVLYGGNQQKVPVRGSPFSTVTGPTRLYTDTELNQLFILEPSQKRVVSFLKDKRAGGSFPSQLLYTAQYVFKGVGELRDLYVSKDEGKLYVMDESKVYVVSLTQ